MLPQWRHILMADLALAAACSFAARLHFTSSRRLRLEMRQHCDCFSWQNAIDTVCTHIDTAFWHQTPFLGSCPWRWSPAPATYLSSAAAIEQHLLQACPPVFCLKTHPWLAQCMEVTAGIGDLVTCEIQVGPQRHTVDSGAIRFRQAASFRCRAA